MLKRWIDLAPWPDAKTQARYNAEERAKPVTAEGVLLKTSGGTSEDWTYRRYKPEDVWAFQPVVKPKVPQGAANPWMPSSAPQVGGICAGAAGGFSHFGEAGVL